jgi:exodeoxyribonuclease V beta subunit
VDVLRERFPAGNELVDVNVAAAGPPTTAPAMTPAPGATNRPDRSDTADLSAATLGRVVAPRGGRWSFTALASRRLDGHGSAPSTNPDDDSLGDRGSADEPTGDPAGIPGPDVTTGDGVHTEDPSSDTPEVLMPWGLAGADFGTRVHTVLERVDFTSGDLPDTLAEQVTATGAVPGTPGTEATTRQHQELVAALAAAVATPLGPAFAGPDGERSLGTLKRTDRLDELEFDLSLTTAPETHAGPTLGSVLGVVTSYLSPDDPVGAWARHASGLARPFPVTGYLTGSIDLVARITTPDGDERFCAMDYKTNRLEPAPGTTDAPGITAYAPDALTGAMASHHYPLQALVYGVALYRYLRWRLPQVDPDTVIGPVGYLFLRGMVGPDTPAGHDGGRYGVFAWQPPPGLLAGVSNHLSGIGASGAGATP